ncbi:MAG: hypothetical protein RLY31_2211 [Bacteroidota bacterium]
MAGKFRGRLPELLHRMTEMKKPLVLHRRNWRLLLWSVVPAAFIGPGTVTTCAKAGAVYDVRLLWTLTFSMLTTFLLQEAAARLTIATGEQPGAVIARRLSGRTGGLLRWFLFGTVAFGCTAYQAGNILGAVAGLQQLTDLPDTWLTTGLAVFAGGLLWRGDLRHISGALAFIVFGMGILFGWVAIRTGPDPLTLFHGLAVPTIPEGGGWLVVGLIGTTVVPYSIFLTGGMAQGQDIGQMRRGLGMAILVGGLISVAVLVVGMGMEGTFSLNRLAETLSYRIDPWAGPFFAIGLFAAGFSSAVTAPLAAAVTARSILGGNHSTYDGWSGESFRFRSVWSAVLVIGTGIGLSGLQPVPVILAAQALNGLLLPVVSLFLLLAVNDPLVLHPAYRNGTAANLAMGLAVAISFGLGIYNLWRVFADG